MESPLYNDLVLIPQLGVCGLACRHCWVDRNLKEHVPFEKAKALIDNYAGVFDEPAITENAFLYPLDELSTYPEVIDLLQYGRERNVVPQPTLVTNGEGIATRDNWEEILRELRECGLNGLLLTVYGDEEYHDWFTGVEGSFRRILEATRRADEFGFWTVWNMYVTRDNVECIAESARLKSDGKVRISVPSLTAKWEECAEIHADISDFRRLPEECSRFVRWDFRSEAEWLEMILSGGMVEDDDEESSKGKRRYRSLYVYDDIVSEAGVYPELEHGNISDISLRDVYLRDPVPPGHFTMDSIDKKEYARKYGRPESRRACSEGALLQDLIGRSMSCADR